MVIEFKVARGWKAIRQLVGDVSSDTVRRMVERGLPVKYDHRTPILTSSDYQEWQDKLPKKPEA